MGQPVYNCLPISNHLYVRLNLFIVYVWIQKTRRCVTLHAEGVTDPLRKNGVREKCDYGDASAYDKIFRKDIEKLTKLHEQTEAENRMRVL